MALLWCDQAELKFSYIQRTGHIPGLFLWATLNTISFAELVSVNPVAFLIEVTTMKIVSWT